MTSSSISSKKKVIFMLSLDKIKDLKWIALEQERTQRSLFEEGVDFILNKYKKASKR
jgi:hypothetical protein